MEKAKELVKIIKDSKLRVQAAINADLVRVSGKDKDTLQQVIQLLKSREFDFDMQFTIIAVISVVPLGLSCGHYENLFYGIVVVLVLCRDIKGGARS